MMQQISEHLFLWEDTCNVYIVRAGDSAVLIDFGSGAILDHLGEIGVQRVTDVLITHHHRDQTQGLSRAVGAGSRIWVPHAEQDLIAQADAHWQAREIYMNYNMRQDRFSPFASVEIDGTLLDYETRHFGGFDVTVVPTPGHTIGSISLLAEVDGARVAFTGDLISAPGQVWSMAATQWTYNGAEGVAAGIASLLDLKDRAPDVLLPSHGAAMDDPPAAIDLLVDRFWRLLQLRGQNKRLFLLREHPYVPVTPHVLWHRASMANSYVLLSDSKKALFFDFGYDFITGMSGGSDRASRRPWLYTIPALKREYGVERIDVVVPTHFHDDHVAGIELLRRVEGTQVWAAEIFADILAQPDCFDLPCLWYDPVPVDRTLPLETPVIWEEYTFTLHHLPGHTYYAVAISFEANGKRYLVAGDQYQSNAGLELNYVYQNRFERADYAGSAALYRRLNPDIILTGHWDPLHVAPGYFDQLDAIGSELQTLHDELLDPSTNLGDAGVLVRLSPYQVDAVAAEPFDLRAEISNPYAHAADAQLQFVLPDGWHVSDASAPEQPVMLSNDMATVRLNAAAAHVITFRIIPSRSPVRRARVGLDLTVGGRRFGQHGEALITVKAAQ